MNIVLWVILSLLAAFGLAGAVGMAARRGASGPRGYYVVPLHGGAERTEALLRRSISRARWSGGETMLILDMGADEESLAICGEMLGAGGLICCREDNFFDTLRALEAL